MWLKILLTSLLKTMEDVSFRYPQFPENYTRLLLIIPKGVMFGLGIHMLLVSATTAKGNRLRYIFRSRTIGIASSMLIIFVIMLRGDVGNCIHSRGTRNKHLAHTDFSSSLYR